MLREVRDPDRTWVVDECSKHALALRQVPDHVPGRLVDAFVDEFDEMVALAADTEGAVAGVDEFDRGVHDRPQCHVEV